MDTTETAHNHLTNHDATSELSLDSYKNPYVSIENVDLSSMNASTNNNT